VKKELRAGKKWSFILGLPLLGHIGGAENHHHHHSHLRENIEIEKADDHYSESEEEFRYQPERTHTKMEIKQHGF
jgi:hypothetical protein